LNVQKPNFQPIIFNFYSFKDMMNQVFEPGVTLIKPFPVWFMSCVVGFRAVDLSVGCKVEPRIHREANWLGISFWAGKIYYLLPQLL
jgi:hypothetical protein